MDIDLAGLLYEHDAERACKRQPQIEDAALWCKARYPHKSQFLNDIYTLLMAEQRALAKFGLHDAFKTGAVKPSPVLSILTPKQALRLLEAHKRSMLPNSKWLRNLDDLEKAESDEKLAKTLAALRHRISDDEG